MTVRASIDLNSDLGEGAGTDAQLMPIISSVNIACGAHAGDDATMRATIALARRFGGAGGAHQGYPDREHSGRERLAMTRDELSEEVARQIRALRRVDPDLKVSHVKAHGALYNEAWRDTAIAKAIVAGVNEVFPPPTAVALFAAPKSVMVDIALRAGLRVVREGFADRGYGGVRAYDGSFIELAVDTLCLHGDTPGAPAIAAAVRDALAGVGVKVQA